MRAKMLCAFAFMCLLSAAVVSAQPSIQWQRCLGGSASDGASSIQQTADGGFIIAGGSCSNDGDVSGNHGNGDCWVVKLNSAGNIIWQKSLGGSGSEWAKSIQQTTDGGFIIAGLSNSTDGDVSGHHPGGYYDSDSIWHEYTDYWVVKLDPAGNIIWQKCFGGSSSDWASSIQQTADGGYIVAGKTRSNDGDVSGNHGSGDYWVVKLNSVGEIQWQKCLGGSDNDVAYSIHQTSDGGFIVAGKSYSNDGDVSGNHGSGDCWIVKLDSAGEILWQKCLGGSDWDVAHSIQQTTDGGFIVAGYSHSANGDVSGNHGSADYWIVKLDSAGNIIWQKCLGGSDWDVAYSIQQTTDGGFIVVGVSNSNDGDITGHHPGGYYDSDSTWYEYPDYWVVKLDSAGNIIWQKSLGGSDEDYDPSIQQTADGGFIIAGESCSNDGDVSGNHGSADCWIVKLSPEGKITENTTIPDQFEINISPNPFNSSCEIAVPAGAKIEIYNLEGNMVHKPATSGTRIIWTPGKSVPSGVYLVRAVSPDGNSKVKRVVYIK